MNSLTSGCDATRPLPGADSTGATGPRTRLAEDRGEGNALPQFTTEIDGVDIHPTTSGRGLRALPRAVPPRRRRGTAVPTRVSQVRPAVDPVTYALATSR